jgi:cytochrome P450
VVHRDRRWFEEPEAFRPERWEGDFVQMEAVLVLATIAQRFRLSLVPGQRITPTPYVTLRPEPGIRMLVARR